MKLTPHLENASKCYQTFVVQMESAVWISIQKHNDQDAKKKARCIL